MLKCVLNSLDFLLRLAPCKPFFLKKNSVASQKTLNFKAFAIKFTNFLNFSQNLAKIQHKKAISYKSVLENSKKDEPLRANFVAFANALHHLNAMPLSVVAVLAPCAWGENLACSGAWQGVINSATHTTATNSMWQIFAGTTAHGKFGLGKRGETGKAKMGQCLGGGLLSLSLSLSLLALFGTLKILNALFMRFCALFVILSVAKNPKNLRYALFLDTSLTLSMTNLGKSSNLIVCHTQILKQKFKFSTQNSRHFINSTHFITLSQILSHTQGFFIFLPQVFAQFLLINSTQRIYNGNLSKKRLSSVRF